MQQNNKKKKTKKKVNEECKISVAITMHIENDLHAYYSLNE